MQDEITERVVAAIEPELYAAENIRSRRKPPESLGAWECVMRALSLISQGTLEANHEAERLCRRAIAIASGYGQAHSLLACALVRRGTYSGEMRSLTAEINAEAQAALAIDDRDPWAYLVQGNLLNRLSHFDDAKRALHPAVEFNPNFPLAHAQLASPLANQGAYPEALDSANHALRLSPNDRNVRAQASIGLMIVDLAAQRHAQCIVSARTMIENSPEHIVRHIFLTAARSIQGDVAAAAEARDRLFRGELPESLREGLRNAGVPGA